ncbi:siroheme synthase CysG [Acidisphaera sp. L21]|uniref:siroheme synthase CysG n=1 Tax=Acidisphaera sp. L21 TaxID=1641851 RepID=UPI00131C0C8C|nr:siroheme synthase CysG [Acidisphaera sp. L21]
MRYFPIFMDLTGRHALVLGDGEASDRKALALEAAGAIVIRTTTFQPAQLDECAVAIAAEAAESEIEALVEAANRRGIPFNVVDRPALCSFITPAIVDRSPLMVAISSGGAAPVLARLIRARIESLVPPAFGRLAAIADEFKAELRRRFPNTSLRRRILERALGGRVADLVVAGQENAAREEMTRQMAEGADSTGIVYLVGAGPGSADLLTLRAHRLLGEADVIVHDRLIGTEVLDMARRDAERIYVGKARANHCLPQEGINDLLIRLGREGRKVVRLKGGDPFVFGRGGEEAEALEAAGIAFEVVPGVTAALACAAQAGIPLTHRDATRSVTFVTGHTKDGRLDLDFVQLARGGTIAVYMGIVTLPLLRDGLFAAGLAADTPAALIERGGTSAQRVLTGTLDSLAAEAPGWSQGGPTLVLIGDVVGRRVGLRA